ncbi:hypothetical protein OGAPHI_001353 [Ogataea philodendri]|uniref:Uncharacterized protein n=1 Tax=Ogataea philodendri TaxID=1378263 RepID=A0A9P8PCA0_9ASCO|nr:uncharacterized protein OGAPHI_001353 [Ogataea philodendri]KAH3669232.1 hypothetical protein OGAPHI_001353 [Ogataea philodendri]
MHEWEVVDDFSSNTDHHQSSASSDNVSTGDDTGLNTGTLQNLWRSIHLFWTKQLTDFGSVFFRSLLQVDLVGLDSWNDLLGEGQSFSRQV